MALIECRASVLDAMSKEKQEECMVLLKKHGLWHFFFKPGEKGPVREGA